MGTVTIAMIVILEDIHQPAVEPYIFVVFPRESETFEIFLDLVAQFPASEDAAVDVLPLL